MAQLFCGTSLRQISDIRSVGGKETRFLSSLPTILPLGNDSSLRNLAQQAKKRVSGLPSERLRAPLALLRELPNCLNPTLDSNSFAIPS